MNALRKTYLDHPIISAIISVVVMMGLLRLLWKIPLPSYEASYIVSEGIGAVIMTIIIYLINGEGELLFSFKGIGYAFKLSWLPLLITLGLTVLMIVGSLVEGTSISSNPILVILGAVILSIFVGYFEEGLFRGIVLNAFLLKMGENFKGILMACIYSSILFGFVHVYSDFFDFFLNPSTFSVSALLQVIGKTLSTGSLGFILAVIFLRTHNLTNVAIIHGLYDFGTFLVTFLFNQQGLAHYVEANTAQAKIFTIEYFVQLIVMLPAVIYAYRQLKKVSVPQYSFFKEPWFPQTVSKNK